MGKNGHACGGPTELTMVKTLLTAYKNIQKPRPEMDCKCYQTV